MSGIAHSVCMNNDINLPVFKVCNCDTYVHEECYKRLVNVPSHVTHCAVCRQPYADSRVPVGASLEQMVYIRTLIVGCVGVTLPQAWADVAVKAIIATSMLSVNAVLAFAIIVWHRRHGRVCCIWPERQITSKILHLSEPLQVDRPMQTSESGGADRSVATLQSLASNNSEIVLTHPL